MTLKMYRGGLKSLCHKELKYWSFLLEGDSVGFSRTVVS